MASPHAYQNPIDRPPMLVHLATVALIPEALRNYIKTASFLPNPPTYAFDLPPKLTFALGPRPEDDVQTSDYDIRTFRFSFVDGHNNTSIAITWHAVTSRGDNPTQKKIVYRSFSYNTDHIVYAVELSSEFESGFMSPFDGLFYVASISSEDSQAASQNTTEVFVLADETFSDITFNIDIGSESKSTTLQDELDKCIDGAKNLQLLGDGDNVENAMGVIRRLVEENISGDLPLMRR